MPHGPTRCHGAQDRLPERNHNDGPSRPERRELAKFVRESLGELPIGALDAEGECPDGSLLALAQRRAFEFWGRTLLQPSAFFGESPAGRIDDTTLAREPGDSSDQPESAAGE